MKAKRFLFVLVACIICVFSVVASEKTLANSKKLNREQKETLKYAQKLLTRMDDNVALPLEINAFIEDSITNEQYQAIAIWAEAYFEDTEDYLSHIVIPLKAVTPQGVIISCLNVRYSKGYNFYRTVETILSPPSQIQKDDGFSGIVIKSNLMGIFMRAFVYDNGVLKEQIEGLIGNKGYGDYNRRPGFRYRKSQPTLKEMGVKRFSEITKNVDHFWRMEPATWNRIKNY